MIELNDEDEAALQPHGVEDEHIAIVPGNRNNEEIVYGQIISSPGQADSWELRSDFLTCHHVVPRIQMS